MNREVLKEKIGAIISSSASDNAKVNDILYIINYSEEQIEDKDWEIVKYLHIPTTLAIGSPVITDNTSPHWNKAVVNTDNEYKIYAVRIKSTGNVFKIGDKVLGERPQKYYTITKFDITNNSQIIASEYVNGKQIFGSYVESLEHYTESLEEKTDMEIDGVKYIVTKSMADKINQIIQNNIKNEKEKIQPLLTTEDGVNLYNESDTLWLINGYGKEEPGPSKLINCGDHVRLRQKLGTDGSRWYTFSTKAARDKYILENKPMFSITDIDNSIKDPLMCIDNSTRDWIIASLRISAEQKLSKQ